MRTFQTIFKSNHCFRKHTTEIPSQVSPLLKKVPAALFSFPTQSPVQLKTMVEKPLEVSNVDSKILQPNVGIFGPVTHDQLKKIIDKKPLEVSNVDSQPNVGFFEPVTQDPIYNWIWADVQEENKDFDNYENFNQDDLRDPDMTTIGTGKVSIKGGYRLVHVLFVRYFRTSIWNDIMTIYLLFFFLPSQKRTNCCRIFFYEITQPFQS